MRSLGERIKDARKKKKMTLQEVAGGTISKGMLSLIENNKAKPSMESLTAIADKLDISVSRLLKDDNEQQLHSLLDEVEGLYYKDMDYSQEDKVINHYKEITGKIAPYLPILRDSYAAGKLLELYSYSSYYSRGDDWEEAVAKAEDIYQSLNLTARLAKIGGFKATVQFNQHLYKEALDTLMEEKQKIFNKEAYIDPLTRLDFDYNEAVFRLAVGEAASGLAIITDAIAFSKKEKVFYHMDDLFRLAAGYGLLFGDEQKVKDYTEKLEHYAALVDDGFYKVFNLLMDAEKRINFKKDYKEALTKIEEAITEMGGEQINVHFLVTKGKALYGLGRFEEALAVLEQVEVPYYLHHPYDLSMIYVGMAYKALCYYKLNEMDKALRFITITKENFEMIPDNDYKQFANEAYRTIASEL